MLDRAWLIEHSVAPEKLTFVFVAENDAHTDVDRQHQDGDQQCTAQAGSPVVVRAQRELEITTGRLPMGSTYWC